MTKRVTLAAPELSPASSSRPLREQRQSVGRGSKGGGGGNSAGASEDHHPDGRVQRRTERRTGFSNATPDAHSLAQLAVVSSDVGGE